MEKVKREPAYLQIYMQIREKIVDGIYRRGAKLPSKRVLAADLDVSIITIEHAYALLCDEGYVESRERSGYFVIFKKEDGFVTPEGRKKESSLEVMEEKQEELVLKRLEKRQREFNLKTREEKESVEMEFPFSIMAKTMRMVITDMGKSIFTPSPEKGSVELRKAVSGYLARSRGIHTSVDQIIIGSGSEYLYRLICELLGKDKVYGIEFPSYKKIEQVYQAAGVELEKIPLIQDGLDSRYLVESKVDILHISPYRSYPSRVTASASKRYEYIQWAKEKGRFLVEDDFESEFSVSKKVEETLFSLSDQENVIYMNTFSKTIDSSLRVGYMVLPKCLLEKYEAKLGFYSCTVPTYIQIVLAKLIENGDFERHINRVRRKKRKTILDKNSLSDYSDKVN